MLDVTSFGLIAHVDNCRARLYRLQRFIFSFIVHLASRKAESGKEGSASLANLHFLLIFLSRIWD